MALDAGLVTTWVGRDALMYVLKSTDQILQDELRQWREVRQCAEMVNALGEEGARSLDEQGARFDHFEATRVTAFLDDRAARRIAQRLVVIDWSVRQGWFLRQFDGFWGGLGLTATVFGGLILVGALALSSPGAIWTAGIMIGAGLVFGGIHWWGIHRRNKKLHKDKAALYKALTGRDLKERASTKKVDSAAPEALAEN